MNDKLHLTVKRENVEQNSNFGNNFESRRTETTQIGKNLENVTNLKWFCNRESVNMTMNGSGLLVQFNPNKLTKAPYGKYIPFNQYKDLINEQTELIHSLGIDIDLWSARIARYDNSFDLHISKPYKEYFPLFNSILPNIRQSRKRTNVDTLYYGNRTTEIAIYDKLTEVLKQTGLDYGSNLLRVELRHLKNNTKYKFLPRTEIDYMKQRSDAKNHLDNYLFSNKPEVLSDSLKQRITQIFYNEGTMIDILKSICSTVLIPEADYYKTILKQSSTDSTKRRNNRFIKEILQLGIDTIDLQENYDELKERFGSIE